MLCLSLHFDNHMTYFPTVLLRLLVNDNMDGMVEAARVFGNLSRTQSIRDFLTSKKGKVELLK